MKKIGSIITITLAAAGFFSGGCAGINSDGAAKEKEDMSDILVMVGDSALRMADVEPLIPPGMASADSLALFNSIVEGWLEDMLLMDVAEENAVDMAQIDRLTADYRRKLLIAAYRRSLRESHRQNPGADSLKRYYEEHRENLILERPVVKGLYVKLPSDAKRLADVRRWMMTPTPDAIDNLEQYGLAEATEYSFFEDRWTDWETLRRQIPYRFGNADDFVSTTTDFETHHGGMTYLLHISGYLPSGEVMPMEVALPEIQERLETLSGDRYEHRLVETLYARAAKEGKLRFFNYKRNRNETK